MNSEAITLRAKRVAARLEELALVSEEEARLTRTYGSPAMRAANDLVSSWAREAGLGTSIDAIGNLRCRTMGESATLLLLGSHLDTVRDAGRFDGALGVVAALDCIAHRTPRKFEIELIGFCDEEGVRFQSTYLGSRAVAGTFDRATLALRDDRGIALGEAIRIFGGDPSRLDSCTVAREALLGYVELHLEQGPVLEVADEPLGVVTAIAGQSRLAVEFRGQAGHAGTTPMTMRRDALTAAAEFTLAVESSARLQGGLVATVGRLEIGQAASNVIPGQVALTVDVRSASDTTRRVAVATLESIARSTAARRGLQLEWRIVQETAAAACDLDLRQSLKQAVTASGHVPIELPSGAGHDAAALTEAGIHSALLFVRCRGGLSHHPEEFVSEADLGAALAAMDAFLASL